MTFTTRIFLLARDSMVSMVSILLTFLRVEKCHFHYDMQKIFFCSTLSEFENFLLCKRILINVTTCQNETSS
jgi:hypothetical protein